MESLNQALPQEMESAKLPPQEILPRPTFATSASLQTSAVSCFGTVPADSVFGHFALVPACFFPPLQSSAAIGRESGPETQAGVVVFSHLFQLLPVQDRESVPER